MKVQMIYLFIYYTLSFIAIYLFIGDSFGRENAKVKKVRFRKNQLADVLASAKKQLKDDQIEELFVKSGIKFSVFTYKIIRYFLFVSSLLAFIYFYITKDVPKAGLFLIVMLFFISSPRLLFWGYKTPFSYVMDFLTKQHNAKKDKELFRVIMQLKNFSFSGKDGVGYSSDYIIEEVMKFTDITKPIFARMLSIWQLGDRENASEYFANSTNTKLGRELANLFIKLDYLNIDELKEQLSIYQASIKAENRTLMERRNLRRGNILYGFTVLTASLVLLNFIVIVLYIDVIRDLMINF